MAALSPEDVTLRVQALVESLGYTKSEQPLAFDKQPATNMDCVYYMEVSRTATQGYVGPQTSAHFMYVITTARRSKRDPWAQKLAFDLDARRLELLLAADYVVYEYDVFPNTWRTSSPDPEPTQDFVFGRFIFEVQLDLPLGVS